MKTEKSDLVLVLDMKTEKRLFSVLVTKQPTHSGHTQYEKTTSQKQKRTTKYENENTEIGKEKVSHEI